MKCICCYKCNGKEYRLYVDLSVNNRANSLWFILLPSFKITKYMNNRAIPEVVRKVFNKRLEQFYKFEIQFK